MNIQQPNTFQQFNQAGPSGFNTGFSNSYSSHPSQPFSSGFSKPPQGTFGIPPAMPSSTPATSFSNVPFTQSQSFNSNHGLSSGFSQPQFQNSGNQRPFGTQPAPLFTSPMNIVGSPMKGFQSGFQQSSQGMMSSRKGTQIARYRVAHFEESAGLHTGVTSISGLDEYKNQSIEELRFEDYKFNDGYNKNIQIGIYPITSQPSIMGTTSQFGGIMSAMKTTSQSPSTSGMTSIASNTAGLPNFGGNLSQNQWSSNGTFAGNRQQSPPQSIFSQSSASNTMGSSGSSISGGANSVWQTQAPQNSLFSQPNPLFPQTANQQKLSQTSNTGSSNAQVPSTSLFGNINLTPNQQPIMQTGSLFGASLNQSQTSLFSSNTQQNNSATVQSSSLFGSNTSNSQFIGATMNSSGSSLFAGIRPDGSMFGSIQHQAPYYTPAPPPPQQAQGSLFNSAQSFGANLFPNNPQNIAGTFPSAQTNMYYQAQGPQMDTILKASKDPHGLLSVFSYNILNEIASAYKKDTEKCCLPQKTSLISRFSDTPKSSHDISIDKWRQNIDKRSSTPKIKRDTSRSCLIERKEKYIITKKLSFEKLRLEEYSDDGNSKYFKAVSPLSESPKRVKTIEIIAAAYVPYPVRMAISATSGTTIKEIRSKICKHLESVEESRIQLTFKSTILKDSDTINSLYLMHHDVIDVIVIQDPQETKQKFAPAELLPKLTKNDYFITPSMIDLARMTTEELKNVKNFTIENEFGKIVFDGETNVTNLNLDEIVEIKPKLVNVYPNDQDKPEVGKGLNKSATVYLFNCVPKKSETDSEYRKRLIEVADTEFINWDRISKIWVFKVQHF